MASSSGPSRGEDGQPVTPLPSQPTPSRFGPLGRALDALPRSVKRAASVTARIGFVALPGLIALFLLEVQFGASPLDCKPDRTTPLFNDEVHYWAEVDAYRAAGFNGGYFVFDDAPARAAWSHFGPHGPGFPVVYGTLARVFGWHECSYFLFHVGFVTLGAAVWLLLCKPDAFGLLLAACLVATFWPLYLFFPSALQEPFHMAVALALAGLYYRSSKGGAVWSGLFVAVAVLAAAVRLTWALTLIPWAVSLPVGKGRKALLFAFSVAVIGVCWRFWDWVAAPYPSFVSRLAASGSVGDAFRLLSAHTRESLVFLVRPGGDPLMVAERLQVAGLVLMSLLMLLNNRWLRWAGLLGLVLWFGLEVWFAALVVAANYKRKTKLFTGLALLVVLGLLNYRPLVVRYLNGDAFLPRCSVAALILALDAGVTRRLLSLADREAGTGGPVGPSCPLFCGTNLVLITGLVICLYEIASWRDYRVIAPHLLLSVMAFATGARRHWLVLILLSNLSCVPEFRDRFADLHRPRFTETREVIDLRPYLAYDPGKGPRENTVLVPGAGLFTRVRVPPGVGVSLSMHDHATPLDKARYVFSDRDVSGDLEPLFETGEGRLYRRRD